jgi:predicted NBD/HSP70 family sugar kinase
MKNSNTICLNGKNLKKDLENLLNKSVIVSNDANCFAIAEATLGSAHKINPQSEVVVGLILGTGCGSGVVVNGKIIHGMHGLSGEWGHNFLDSSGGQCYCGRVGCVETIISGPALEKYYQKLTGHAVNMATIVDNYRIGLDLASLETMERFFYFFGKAVAVLVNILDPEIIVVGGGLGQIDELYVDGRTEVAKYIFNHELKTHFVKPTLGDSAGVFGAALL